MIGICILPVMQPNYSDEDGKYTWHMDGKIHTYKIKYIW